MRLRAFVITALLATEWFGQARAGVLHRVDPQSEKTQGPQSQPKNSKDRESKPPDVVFPDPFATTLLAAATPEHNGPAWNYMPITLGVSLIASSQPLKPGTFYLVHDNPGLGPHLYWANLPQSHSHPVPEEALRGLIHNPHAQTSRGNETGGLPVSEPGTCLLLGTAFFAIGGTHVLQSYWSRTKRRVRHILGRA